MKAFGYQHSIAELESRVQHCNHFLEEQFRLIHQTQFEAGNERHPGQGELFKKAEELAQAAHANATHYSVVETPYANDLVPFNCMMLLLLQLSQE